MKKMNELIAIIKNNKYFYFIYIPFVIFVTIITLILLRYPDKAAEGVSSGLAICFRTIIPSLFPFLFFSSLLSSFPFSQKLCEKMSGITHFIFGLPGITMPIIIMSLLGGFPVGAVLIRQSFEQGRITASEGKRMLLFCVNPGPAFTLSVIGLSLLGSIKAGLMIYICSLISTFIMGVLSRFFTDGDDLREYCKKSCKKSIAEIISFSAEKTITNIINICAWVIIFSCVGTLMDILPLETTFLHFLKMISEVTNGAIISVEYYSLPILCAIIGFSGFCIHLQIMPAVFTLRLKYKFFLISRIICAAINCILCFLLMKIFPLSIETVMISSEGRNMIFPSSVPLCVFLMLMCGLFVVGDNYIFRKKLSKENAYEGNKPHLY